MQTPNLIEPKRDSGEIRGTQIVLSEDSQQALETASLNSMTLLSRSANKLLSIMETCVSDLDLKKVDEGVTGLDFSKKEQAIMCANALAQTVQTQINMVKALTPLVKGRK